MQPPVEFAINSCDGLVDQQVVKSLGPLKRPGKKVRVAAALEKGRSVSSERFSHLLTKSTYTLL